MFLVCTIPPLGPEKYFQVHRQENVILSFIPGPRGAFSPFDILNFGTGLL
jgi:hypothetical protein